MTEPADPIRILHVDDDPAFAELVATVLERDQFVVETATDVDDGLERVTEESVDCVVSDYDLPGRNGIEFLRAVRAEHPDLPFVLFTGKGSEEVASEAITAGVTDYLQKGTGTDQYTLLANRIRNAVDQRRAERERERMRERMELALEETASIIYEIDLETDRISRHGAVESFYPVEPGRIPTTAEFVERVVHPDDRERFEAFVDRLRAGDADTDVIDYRTDPERGEVRWLRGNAHRTDGRILGLVRDVTGQKTRERELRRVERRYRAVFDDPNILVRSLDVDGTVRDINRTAMEYVDATLEEVRGTPLWETPWFGHSASVREDVREWIGRAARGEYVEFEADLVRPDGTLYTVQGVFRPVTDDAGEVVSILISDRDVTEQRERERELEEANVLLSTLVETLPVGVLAEDGSRDVLAANDRFLELFGFDGSPADLRGRDCDRLAEEAAELFAEPAAFVDRIDELVATHEPVDEEELTLRDGRTFVRSHEPIDLPDGDGHLWVYRDATDGKERERRLRETTSWLEALFEQSPDMINVHDADGNVLEPNPRFIEETGYSGTELEAMKVWELDREMSPENARALWRGMDRGDRVRLDGTYRRRDGSTFPVEVHVRRIDLDGDDRFMVISRDVSEREAYERELERQNERLEEFTSVVSHDLRNPLNVAQGRLTLAREAIDDDPESAAEHLETVERAHDRMEALVTDLLALAREGAGTADLTGVDLPSLVEACWGTVETGAATLVVDADRRISADESRVRQLFENLVRNAVEHGDGDVTVTVGLLPGGFYVEDDGPGIPEAKREEVFEAGYSTSREGTGFGLSIVQRIAETHGWDVRVTEGTNGGARFEVTGVAFVDG